MAGCRRFANADLIAAGLSPLAPEQHLAAASRLFLHEIEDCIATREDFAEALPISASIIVGQVCIYLIHDLAERAIDPAATGVRVVISGHSHKPSLQERDGVLYLNPGSAVSSCRLPLPN